MQPDETQDPLALALSLDLAPTLSPDDAAANAVLAKRYQLPVEMVQQYHADYKKQAWYEDAITTTQDSPILKSFLANENHAKIMQDDLSNLVKMEGASTSIKPAVRAWDATKPSPTVGDVAYGIGMALPQGIGAAVYGTGRQLGDFFGIDELSRYSAQQARLVQKSIQDTTPEFESAWSRGLYGGATSTARMIPAIAAGLLTKNPNVLLATLGIQTEAEAYSKYRERGGTSAEAFVGAMTEGTVEVATELLPMGFMMQTLGKTGMGTFLTGLLAREIPTEQLATFLQDATDTAIANPDKSWGEFWRERPGAAVETAFATLVPTAFFGVLHKVVTVSQNHQADVQATERVSGTLQVLSELSAVSKVRPRPGQTFSDYIESVTDGTPVQEVALSPLALQQSGQAEEAMNLSPSIRAQYESALTLGTDVVIPTAEYLSTIAPTELGGLLLDDLKVPGESMTRKEAREYVAQQSATFEAVIATQVSEHLTRADLDASSRVVGAQILSQLQQTTRYTKEQAKDLSVLIRSFYDTTALKAGMTPEALFTQIPYSVQGAGIPSTGTLTQPAFAEANYRPEVSAWAKTQFGDRTAPNNSAVWQNFTQWFGDSKVVHDDGLPRVAYKAMEGDVPRISDVGLTHVALDQNTAKLFAGDRRPTQEVYVKSDKPFDHRSPSDLQWLIAEMLKPKNVRAYNKQTKKIMGPDYSHVADSGYIAAGLEEGLYQAYEIPVVIDLIKSRGYDAVYMRENVSSSLNLAVFKPEQIKSATDNDGNYGSTNQSILNQPARDRSVDEIHAFATAHQIVWDDDPAFMDFTESVTGKRKIDALTQPERNRLYAALESRVGGEGPTSARKIEPYWEKQAIKYERMAATLQRKYAETGKVRWSNQAKGNLAAADGIRNSPAHYTKELTDPLNEITTNPHTGEFYAYRGATRFVETDEHGQYFSADLSLARKYAAAARPYGYIQRIPININALIDTRSLPVDATDDDFSNLFKRYGINEYTSFYMDKTSRVTYSEHDTILLALAENHGMSGYIGHEAGHPNVLFTPSAYKRLFSSGGIESRDAVEAGIWDGEEVPPSIRGLNPLLHQASVSTFYSHALNVIEDKMPARASVEQIRNILSPENGVKADELKWLGLDAFLKNQDYFTKDEVLAFVRANQVQVKEVVKGGNLEALNKDSFKRFSSAVANLSFEEAFGQSGKFDDRLDGARSAAAEAAWNDENHVIWKSLDIEEYTRISETKFSRYQLPGGTNYGELLLTLPSDSRGATASEINLIHSRLVAKGYDGLSGDDRRMLRLGGEDAAAFLDDLSVRVGVNVLGILNAMAGGDQSKQFTTAHFSEPNVLAHVRFNDRKGPKGEKILFMEEVQSDWHQKGRDEGYKAVGIMSRDEASDIASQAADTFHNAREAARVVYSAATASDQATYDAAKTTFWAIRNAAVAKAEATLDAAIAKAKAVRTAAISKADKVYDAVFNSAHTILKANPSNRRAFYKGIDHASAIRNVARAQAYEVSEAALAPVQSTRDAAVAAAQAVYAEAIAPAQAAFDAATAPAQDAYDAAIATAKAAYDTARVPAEAAFAVAGVVPDAPFKKTWHELAMKRMLRYAAEHGYDTLAWTVGSQQIERYESDLRQNVDAIGWDATRVWALKNKQEVFTGEVDAKTGRFTSGDADGKLISEVLGKSMAEKIAASPTGTLTGDGLSVGGEGMKFFYDQQIPNFVKTYTKKWGATVSDLKLEKIETPVHAVDITAPMRESVLQVGQRLFQTDQGTGPRGAFDPATLKTLLYEKADVSTVWHEMMHFYVEALMQVGTLPNATPQMQADVQALMELFQLPNAQAWAGLTAEQQRPHHEAFAYLGEIYLWEGKAPSSALRAAFERLALFMRQIYRAIRDELNGLYRQQFGIDLPMLTPEVRKVFDRMLVADEQIREAEEIMKLVPLFQTQAQAKMSDAEWLAYKDLAQAAQQESISALTTASLKQMQWLSNAQSKYLKAQQAQHEALRTAIRREVADALPNEPIYRALQWLKTGFIRGADGQEIQATDGFKLDRAALEEMYPTDDGRVDTDRLDWSAIKTLTKEGGLHPDVVAEMFGFPSGDHLVRTLLATPTVDEAITARTDEQMLREHSELTNPAAMKLAMDTALHTEARARLVAVELRHAAKATKPVRLLTAAAKQAAERFLQTQRIKDIHASRYATAERQAGARAEKAMKTGDGAAVTLALQQRLLNNQFVQQAAGIQEEVAAGIRYAKALQTDAAKKRMGADYADQIDALLEQFELGPMTLKAMAARTSLAQWAAQQEAKGFAPDLSPDLLAETRRVPYKMLTVGSFRELIAALKQIDHMGTNAQFLLTAAKTTAYVEARDLIIASINEHAQGRTAEARTPTTKIGRMVHGLKQFAASHLKAATIARVLDGGIDGGPVWEYLIRTANIRGNQETQMTAEATTAITKILAPFLSKPMGGKGRVFPSVQRSFNRESLLAIALNTGNNGNLQRLLGGEGWTRDQITPLLESLTAAEWRAVQEIWDHFESYTPQIAAKQRKLYGQEPDWITPVPFTVQTSDGQQVELRGGYYPIKYDPQASIQAETQADADAAAAQLRGAYTSATTRRSFTKARVEAVTGRPLIYTLSGLYGGVGEIIHDLAWHEWLIDANRLLRSSGIDQAIRTQYGPEWKAQLKSWIEDVATGNRGVQQAGEQALSRLRQGVSAAGIGFNLMSAALQITGFNQSIVRIGAGWTARGIAKVLVSPFEIAQEVNAKSTFMAHRSMTQFRELNEVKNRVEGDSGTLRTIHAGTYFAMMRMQRMVDVPTWWGAYEKGLSTGADEETAIALADQAVIDSQGSGMVKDLSGVERGGPAMKLFTVFYAYMNTVFQMGTTSTMTATGKGKLTADYIMLGIVPVVLAMALKAALRPGDDEEWDWEKLAKALAAEELSYLMGTMIVVREFQEAAKIVTGAEGAGRDYSGPAGIRIVADAVKFMKQASQAEFDTAFRKAAINLLGDIAGLPAAQVNRTIDGFEALTEGKTENPFALVMGYQTKR